MLAVDQPLPGREGVGGSNHSQARTDRDLLSQRAKDTSRRVEMAVVEMGEDESHVHTHTHTHTHTRTHTHTHTQRRERERKEREKREEREERERERREGERREREREKREEREREEKEREIEEKECTVGTCTLYFHRTFCIFLSRSNELRCSRTQSLSRSVGNRGDLDTSTVVLKLLQIRTHQVYTKNPRQQTSYRASHAVPTFSCDRHEGVSLLQDAGQQSVLEELLEGSHFGEEGVNQELHHGQGTTHRDHSVPGDGGGLGCGVHMLIQPRDREEGGARLRSLHAITPLVQWRCRTQ